MVGPEPAGRNPTYEAPSGGRAVPPRRLRAGSAALALVLLFCGDPAGEAPLAPRVEVPEPATPRDVAVLDVDGFGEVRIELLADLAPTTAAHFAALAGRDYYDGTSFHRVVPDFLVQGGDPLTRDRDPRNDGEGGGEERVADERPSVSLVRGIVALANSGTPNSSGAQFFILVADARHLDGKYAVFGRVSAGMDVSTASRPPRATNTGASARSIARSRTWS